MEQELVPPDFHFARAEERRVDSAVGVGRHGPDQARLSVGVDAREIDP